MAAPRSLVATRDRSVYRCLDLAKLIRWALIVIAIPVVLWLIMGITTVIHRARFSRGEGGRVL
jgi:hypothetical protein